MNDLIPNNQPEPAQENKDIQTHKPVPKKRLKRSHRSGTPPKIKWI